MFSPPLDMPPMLHAMPLRHHFHVISMRASAPPSAHFLSFSHAMPVRCVLQPRAFIIRRLSCDEAALARDIARRARRCALSARFDVGYAIMMMSMLLLMPCDSERRAKRARSAPTHV